MKRKISKAGKILCLALAVLLVIGAMPMYNIAAAGTDEQPAVEVSPSPAAEPVQPEPEAGPEPTPTPSAESEATPTPSVEPEQSASPTPSAMPTVSPEATPEPSESPEPTESAPAAYENSISGMLWLDMFDDLENSVYAGDGVRQTAEQPLEGYKVELFKAGDLSAAVQTATTDADGKYSFVNLDPGSYIAGVKTATIDGTEYLLPLFWLDGTSGDNRFVATLDADADAYLYAYTKAITVEADSNITGMDAGMRTPPTPQPMANATYTIDITNSTTVTNSISSQSIPGVTFASNVLTFNTSVDPTDTYILTGTTTTVRIVVQTGVTTDITLNGASITNSVSPFRLLGTSNVNLILSGTNILTCNGSLTTTGAYQAGLHVDPSATLTLSGSGALNATGGRYSAGIGGSYVSSSTVSSNSTGTITINSGTITAKGFGGAGIGGGNCGAGGTTIINGGTVTASGNGAAGIGGGYNGSGGTIVINGGTVTAEVVGRGAGIGGGESGSGGNITITGGTVTAIGFNRSPGIGGGGGSGIGNYGGSAGTITITGGRITATGGTANTTGDTAFAPGIGGGVNGLGDGRNNSGTIIFTGGSIYPSTYYGDIGDNAVNPKPRNGTANGNDVVHMVQFPGYSDNDPFYIVAGGSLRSYDYYANAHPNGTVYPWLIYPGVLTKDATNITTATADLNGETYLEGTYSVTSGYFEVTTTSGSYTSPLATVPITPTGISTGGTVEQYSAPVSGLSSGTTYYYRFVIVTGGVTIYGNEVEFKTPCLVTEHYLKGDGNTLQSANTSNVANGGAFTGTPPATITSGSDTYTYNGYRLGSTTAPLNNGTPTAITISADTNIYYYYIGPPTVSVTHTVTSGTTATLNGTYSLDGGTFVSGEFEISTDGGLSWTSVPGGTLTGLTTTPSVNLTGLTPGATVDYRLTVTSNGGTGTATGSFMTGFAITEKFVDLSGSSVDATGLLDSTVYVSGSYTPTSGTPPTSHTVSGDTYHYIGYKLDSYAPGNTLTSGTPSAVTVTGPRDIYYVYTKALPSIKIEKYDNGGTTPLANAEFKLEKLVTSGGVVDPGFTAVTQTTAGPGGDTTFTNLPAGIYRITETKAPSGFAPLTEAFEVTVPHDITLPSGQTPSDTSYLYSTTSGGNVTYHYYDVTYKVSDQAALAMPAAGVNDTLPPYTLLGGLLVLAAAGAGAVLLIKRRRTKNQPKHAV